MVAMYHTRPSGDESLGFALTGRWIAGPQRRAPCLSVRVPAVATILAPYLVHDANGGRTLETDFYLWQFGFNLDGQD